MESQGQHSHGRSCETHVNSNSVQGGGGLKEENKQMESNNDDSYDDIDELILNEAKTLSKIIKSQANVDCSDDTTDGRGSVGTLDSCASSNTPHTSMDSGGNDACDGELGGEQEGEEGSGGSEENVKPTSDTSTRDGRSADGESAGDGAMFVKIHISNLITSAGVPTDGRAEYGSANVLIMRNSGCYVIGCGEAGQAGIAAKSGVHRRPGFYAGRAGLNDSLDSASLDGSLSSSVQKHDWTMDESEFFSCDESFTVQDLTLRQTENAVGADCQTDESDEQTLSLTSLQLEGLSAENVNNTSTPVNNAPGEMTDGARRAPDVQVTVASEEGDQDLALDGNADEGSVGEILNRDDENRADDPEGAPKSGSHDLPSGAVALRPANKIPGSMFYMTGDDQDSVTDAGYQASESSGQEDTGYEEGETDGTNAMLSSDYNALRQMSGREMIHRVRESGKASHVTGSSSVSKRTDSNPSKQAASDDRQIEENHPDLSGSKKADGSDPADDFQLVCDDSLVIYKPKLSGSELSETLSYVSLSREAVERNVSHSNSQPNSDNHVSLYVELAEAGHESRHMDDCMSSSDPEHFSEMPGSDIDDAEALLAKSKHLTDSESEHNADPENQEQSSNVRIQTVGIRFSSSTEPSAAESIPSSQGSWNDEALKQVPTDMIPQRLTEGSGRDRQPGRRSFEDIVSDVTSEYSCQTSGSRCSSSRSDELLQLLDKITLSGYSMRTQLETAYARQELFQEIGSRVEEVRSSVIRNLQHELEELRAENRTLSDKVTQYRSSSQENFEKIQRLETVIGELRLGKKEPEQGSRPAKKSQQRNVAVSTDVLLLSSTSTQTLFPGQSESESEFGEGLRSHDELRAEIRTSTPSQLLWPLFGSGSEASCPAVIRGSIQLEGEQRSRRKPSVVSLMMDKILNQMNNLANNSLNNSFNTSFSNHDNSLNTQDGQLDDDSEPEGPEKWRRLSDAAVSSDPAVLALQRSLAAACLENELLQANLRNSDKALSHQVERLRRELDEYKNLQKMAEEEADVLKVRLDGDRVEMELLHDQIAALEKSLSRAEAENDSLRAQLNGTGEMSLKDVDIVEELKLRNAQLLAEKVEFERKLEDLAAAKSQLEKDLAERKQNSTESQCARGEEKTTVLAEKEVVVLREEYNYLRNAMDFLQKCLDLYSGEHAADKKTEAVGENQEEEAGQAEGKEQECTADVSSSTRTLTQEQSVQAELTPAPRTDKGRVCEENDMAFPIYKSDIEELKTHVFGWRRLCAGGSLPIQPLAGAPSSSGLNLVGSAPAAPTANEGLSVMRASLNRYAAVSGSASLPATTPGGTTLHDDIMKQSEMVLDIIKESGDIKDVDNPSAFFHWQDVRNSIAHQLLSESHQKIETAPASERAAPPSPKAKTDTKLKSLLSELDKYLQDKERGRGKESNAGQTTGDDIKSKLPDSVRILMKAVERELGASVNITINGSDDQPINLSLNCSAPVSAAVAEQRRLHAEQAEERKDINQRKEKYKEEFDRINAEYEELRKKRLSLLVQAYTGKQDSRPLSSKANSSAADTVETSKALAMAKAAVFRPRSLDDGLDRIPSPTPQPADNRSATAEYLASQVRVQRDLVALERRENPPVTDDVPSQSVVVEPAHSSPKPNALLSSRDNRTISAISQDSQLIKERIRAVREQLNKAEQKRAKSLDHSERYYGYADSLTEQYEDDGQFDDDQFDEPVDDQFAEDGPHQSPRRHRTLTSRLARARKYSPVPVRINRVQLLSTPKREIYPHKKRYEAAQAYWQRCRQEEDSVKSPLAPRDVRVTDGNCDSTSYTAGRHQEDLAQEDYLKYPEDDDSSILNHRGQAGVRRKIPNSYNGLTKERLNKSLKVLHDYYNERDQTHSGQGHQESRAGTKNDDRQSANLQEPITESLPVKEVSTSATGYDLDMTCRGGSFYLPQGIGMENASKIRPTDPEVDLKSDVLAGSELPLADYSVNAPRTSVTSKHERPRYNSPVPDANFHSAGSNTCPRDWNMDGVYNQLSESYHSPQSVHSPRFRNLNSDVSFSYEAERSHRRAAADGSHGTLYPEPSTESPASRHSPHRSYQQVDGEKSDDSRNPESCAQLRHGRPAAGDRLDGGGLSEEKYPGKRKTERDRLSDSIQSLDNCHCNNVDNVTKPNGTYDSPVRDYDVTHYLGRSAEDRLKYGGSDATRGCDRRSDPDQSRADSLLRGPDPEQREAGLKRSTVPSDMTSGDSSRRSEDVESLLTSEAELVVTKDGDILKRARSASPVLDLPSQRDAGRHETPLDVRGRDPATTSGSGFNRITDGTNSRYCEAVCLDALSSPYRNTDDVDGVRWSEPKRHFGLRDTKLKAVTWANPASCSSNVQILKPADGFSGLVESNETCLPNKGILKSGKEPKNAKPETSLLTDEQRHYANELIDQYTSGADSSHQAISTEPSHSTGAEAARHQRNGQASPDSVQAEEEEPVRDDQQLVRNILSKYATECHDDDQEVSELTSQANFRGISLVADVTQESNGQSKVKLTLRDACEVSQIIEKYVQHQCPPAKAILVNP